MFLFNLCYMAGFEDEVMEDQHKIFHQCVLDAYKTLSQCDLSKVSSPTLLQLLFNRTELYCSTTLYKKMTDGDKKKHLD